MKSSDVIDINSFTRFPLTAISLTIIAIAASAIIAYFSYEASFKYAQKHYQEMYLSKARLVAKEARNNIKKPKRELIKAIQSYYYSIGARPSDEYLCVVDSRAILLVHTAHENTVGNNAGKNQILDQENQPLCSLSDLIQTSGDFVGNYISSAGERQVAAFVNIKELDWTIGVHRKKDALLKEVRADFIPVIIGFIIVILLFLPFSFAVLIFTYYRTIRKRDLIENHLHNSLREKEVMLTEIHHRVKNNLQVIISLINLQIMGKDSELNNEALKTIEQRIKSMAIVHEKLYQSDNYADIDFRELLDSLVRESKYAFSETIKNINITINIDKISIGLNHAIPCALIINELLTNSFKHAFHNRDDGEIVISASTNPESGEVHFKYKDNGPGFDREKHAKTGIGLTIATALANQLSGELIINSDRGASYILSFQPEPIGHKSRINS